VQILAECKQYVGEHGRLPAGRAMMTTGGNLPARFVVHTVGPIWRGGGEGEERTLRDAYVNSLDLAMAAGLTTVAFPSISTGAYRYPLARAARVAVGAVTSYAQANEGLEEVRFVLFSRGDMEVYVRELEGKGRG
jgi:O-acetyl-ADP-ribose deacetylase (regulator of RNase III)